MENKTWLAGRIKARRDAMYLTQKELAEMVEVHATTVSCWERGRRPQAKHRRALDAVLGV